MKHDCQLCRKRFTQARAYEAHVESDAHKQRVQAKEDEILARREEAKRHDQERLAKARGTSAASS